MSHRAFSRFRLISIALFVFGLVSVAVAFNPTTAQEAKQRVIARMPVEKDEPLVITDVKVNGKSITFGQKFNANDDWLKSLVVTVKNTSDKRVLFASIELFMQQPDGARGMFDIFYGPWALQNRQPKPEEQLVGIPPGEIAEIGFSVQRYVGLTSFLNDTHIGPSVENVKVRFGSVIFADDTMWRGGFFRRDPTNPRSWNNVNP